MPGSILFVVAQSSTVAYLTPVWRRWLDHGSNLSWRVVATAAALKRIALEQLDDLPLVPINTDTVDGLAQSLGDWRPDCLVMSATTAPIEYTAADLARRTHAPVARIIDTWYGYRRRLGNGNGELDLPDKLIVIDEPAAAAAVSEGIPHDIIEILGQPAWEHVEVLPPADRGDVLFISQPIERHYGMSLGYTENTTWRAFVATMQDRPELFRQVYYSAHPDDDMPAPNMPGVKIVQSGAATLTKAGTAVGMFSSLLTDALLAGRHIVSFQPNNSDCRFARMGRVDLVPHATTPAELVAALAGPPTDGGALRSGLRDSCDRVDRFCHAFAESAAP